MHQLRVTSIPELDRKPTWQRMCFLPRLVGMVVLVATGVGIAGPARGDAPAKWKPTAIKIVGAYEGKGYSQVTADTDCQGLSLGIEQHTVQSGSLLNIINAMPSPAFVESVERHLVTSKDVFLAVIELLRNGERTKARRKSLELQDVETSAKCEGGLRGKTVKLNAKKELEAWLASPPVQAAQNHAADEKLELSFRITECFLRDTEEQAPLHFGQFLFIYGWIVQGGSGSLRDKKLQMATTRVKEYKDYAATKEENIRRKVDYLADWLAVRWSNTERQSYFADAEKTSKHLRGLARKLSSADIHLLFMRQVRASTGNTPYQLTFMNRGVIDLTGRGWVNGTSFDHRNTFIEMGIAPVENRAPASCDGE
jgi:hypothetical protein